MIISIENRAKIGTVMALGFLLATLVAMLVSTAPPAGAATSSGKALSWGLNYYGQLGNGTSGAGTDSDVPVAVKSLTGVKSVKAGCYHGLALKTDGTVWAWGDNYYGQLGNGTSGNYKTTPVAVSNLKGVSSIATDGSHSLALLSSGKVKSWGDNSYGQLGNGISGTESDVPVSVKNLTGVKNIDGGLGFTLAATQ